MKRFFCFFCLCCFLSCGHQKQNTGPSLDPQFPLKEPLEVKKNLRVTVVSDVHPGQSPLTSVLAHSVFETTARTDGMWGTLVLGDVTNTASQAEWTLFSSDFKETLAQKNVRIISGNHDFPLADDGLCCRHSVLESKVPGYRPYWGEKLENVYFVFLDTGKLTKDLGNDQWAFLEAELKKAEALKANRGVDWIAVAMHQVLVSAGDKRDDANMIAMRPRFVSLFKKYGVDVVMGGHQHVAQATLLDGILFINTPSGGGVLRAEYNPSLKNFSAGHDFSSKEFAPELYYSMLGFLDLSFGEHKLGYRLRNERAVEYFKIEFDRNTKKIEAQNSAFVNVCIKGQTNMNVRFMAMDGTEHSVPMYRDKRLGGCWFSQKVQKGSGPLQFRLDNSPTVDKSAVVATYESRQFTTSLPEIFVHKDQVHSSSYFSDAERDGVLETDEIQYEPSPSGLPVLRLLLNDATRIVVQFWCDQSRRDIELGDQYLISRDEKYVRYRLPAPSCSNSVYTVRVFDGGAEFQPGLAGQGRFIVPSAENIVRMVASIPENNAQNVSPGTNISLRFSRGLGTGLEKQLALYGPSRTKVVGQWEQISEEQGGKSVLWVFHPKQRLRKGTHYRLLGPADLVPADGIVFTTRADFAPHEPRLDGEITSDDGYAFLVDDRADNPWGRHGDTDFLAVTWNRRGVFLGVAASLFENDLTLVVARPKKGMVSSVEMGNVSNRPQRFLGKDIEFNLFVSLDASGKFHVAKPDAGQKGETAKLVDAAELGLGISGARTRLGNMEVFIPWKLLGNGLEPFALKGIVTSARGEYAYGDMVPNNSPNMSPGMLNNFLELNPDEDGDGKLDVL